MAKNSPAPWASQITDVVQVRVTPKAARERIEAQPQPDGSLLLKVYVTVVPEDGKANVAVLRLLAKALCVAPSQLVIGRGHTGRDKLIRITQAAR